MKVVLISVAVGIVVFYGLAIAVHKKKYGEWLLPHRWLVCIMRGINVLFSAVLGVVVTKEVYSRGDSKLMTVTAEMAREALEYAEDMMRQEGVIFPEQYIKRAYDCENFAHNMRTWVDLYIAREYGVVGEGVPTRVIGYIRDKGGGHAVMEMIVEGESRFYNPYIGQPSFYGFELSPTELSTVRLAE